MRQSRMRLLLLTLLLMLAMILAACGGDDEKTSDEGSTDDAETEDTVEDDDGDDGDNGDEEDDANDDELFDIADFPTRSEAGEVEEGGTLNFGLVSDTTFDGLLNWNFYDGDPDSQVLDWFDEGLLGIDENYQYTQDGAATFEYSEDHKVWTFTIKDGVKWHDGEELTAEDWAFAYEVIGHADYDGPRYGSDFTIIEGMEAYNKGEADSISGVKVVDEKTLEVTYEKPTPSLFAGGVWPYAMAKHVFEDIAVADMSESDEMRKNPIGIGPFKVDSITPGESVTYSKFADYWQGEPKLDEVVLRVIDPTVIANELESGNIDAVDAFNTDLYKDNQALADDYNFLGKIDESYTYIGFKMGTWDEDNKHVVYSPDESKVGDVELRRAMWYAVDNDAVGEKFYDGFRWNGTTLIIPTHPDFHDDTIETPTYDPDKANEILDAAGYEDVDGDGIRENQDGEELKLNLASMSGGDVAEPLANYYLQAWEAVGIHVELLDGRLQEFNTFYDRVGNGGNDDPEVDVYMGAWGMGDDVDPAGLYGPEAMFNFPRYESEENDRLLAEGVSDDAFDLEYRQKVYKEWQEFMVEEIPVFPTNYRSKLVPVREDILNYTIVDADGQFRHEVGFGE